MCEAVNIYDLFKDILLPGLVLGATYWVNKFQYKAQKDNTLINPRIEFAKKYDQILSFDDYQDDDYIHEPFNHIKQTTTRDENGIEHSEYNHIRKYKKNLKDIASEANFLFSLNLGRKISQLVSKIEKLFIEEYKKDKPFNVEKIFSTRERKYLDSFPLYLKERHQEVFNEYKEIKDEIMDFIYKPKRN